MYIVRVTVNRTRKAIVNGVAHHVCLLKRMVKATAVQWHGLLNWKEEDDIWKEALNFEVDDEKIAVEGYTKYDQFKLKTIKKKDVPNDVYLTISLIGTAPSVHYATNKKLRQRNSVI